MAEYVYEDDDNDEGLTFRKVWYFCKKGWLRMLVYALILAVVATAIAVPIKLCYNAEETAQVSVEFIYKGIERGQSYNGGTFDSNDMISVSVLDNAVTSAGLGDKIKDISALKNNIRVESVLTDEYVKLTQAAANGDQSAADTLRNYTMYPTRFNIVISEPSELGLSEAQAKQLLDSIVKSYYADFAAEYSDPIALMFSSTPFTLSKSESAEYTDIYDSYTQTLSALDAFMKDVVAKWSGDTSAVTALMNKLAALRTDLDRLNSFIVARNVWRNPDDALTLFKTRVETITGQRQYDMEYIEKLAELIKNIQPNTTTIIDPNGNTSTVTSAYPQAYYDFIKQQDEANLRVQAYDTQLYNLDMRIKRLESSDKANEADKQQVEQKLESLEQEAATLVSKFVDMYGSMLISSSVRTVQAPTFTTKHNSLNLWIVYLVVVIAGILVGGIVTAVKIIKKPAIAVKTQKSPSADAEVVSTEAKAKDKDEK